MAVLVESLRTGQTARAEAEYARVERELRAVKRIADGGESPDPAPILAQEPPRAALTANVRSLIADGTATTVAGERVSVRDMMAVAVPTTYLHGDEYVVFSPVNTRQEVFRLAYFVPESAVNQTESSFSGNVARSSVMVIALLLALAFGAVLYINRLRKKQLDSALLAREHMFDLLVENSRTAFVLFSLNRREPTYISRNSLAVVGDDRPMLCKAGAGFAMRSGAQAGKAAFSEINETLRDWDGTGVYRSGF